MPPEPPDASTVSGHLQGLARRIRALRERRGMTQEDLAARCGISVSFASLLERGERSPSYETLLQVASALQLPLWELLRLEDTQDAVPPSGGCTAGGVVPASGVAVATTPASGTSEPGGGGVGAKKKV